MADRDILRRTWLRLVPTGLLVHVAEEALATQRMLTQMAEVGTRTTGGAAALPSAAELIVLLALLSALGYGLLFLARHWVPGAYALVLLQAVLTVNVLSHTHGAITMRQYSPGIVTSWLVVVPLSVVVFGRLRAEQWMTRAKWLALAPAAFVIHGPLLTAILQVAGRLRT